MLTGLSWPYLRRRVRFAARNAPSLPVKPAGLVFRYGVRPHGLDAGASVIGERRPRRSLTSSLARAGKFIEPDGTDEPRLELVARTARREQHAAHPSPVTVNGKTSRPFGLRQSSQDGGGWVAPALATTTSHFGNGLGRSVAAGHGGLRPRRKRLLRAAGRGARQSRSPKRRRRGQQAPPARRCNSPCRRPDGARAPPPPL